LIFTVTSFSTGLLITLPLGDDHPDFFVTDFGRVETILTDRADRTLGHKRTWMILRTFGSIDNYFFHFSSFFIIILITTQ